MLRQDFQEILDLNCKCYSYEWENDTCIIELDYFIDIYEDNEIEKYNSLLKFLEMECKNYFCNENVETYDLGEFIVEISNPYED